MDEPTTFTSLLLRLAQDSPWIAVVGFLLWERMKDKKDLVIAFKEGAQSQGDGAAAVESLENSLGTIQTTAVQTQAAVVNLTAVVIELNDKFDRATSRRPRVAGGD